MIVPETILSKVFEQLPPVAYFDKNKGASTIPVKFDYGNQDDLNLYMEKELGNKTPLVWLVQGAKVDRESSQNRFPLKLVIAKDSEQKTARNKKVWNTEISVYLDPLLENVRRCLKSSNIGFIVNDTDKVYREANYSETDGKSTKTIDHWNVITFECDYEFYPTASVDCVKQINFNL